MYRKSDSPTSASITIGTLLLPDSASLLKSTKKIELLLMRRQLIIDDFHQTAHIPLINMSRLLIRIKPS